MDLLGVNAHRLGLGEPQHQVGIVDAVTHQGRNVVQHDTPDGLRQVSPGVHGNDLADAALFDRLLGQHHTWIKSADMTYHEQTVARSGSLDNPTTLLDGRRHRLLQKHVLAAAECFNGDVVMVVHVGGDADHVDQRIGQQSAIVGVAPLHAIAVGQFVEPLPSPRAQRRQLDTGHRGQRVGMHFAEESQAEHAPANRVGVTH